MNNPVDKYVKKIMVFISLNLFFPAKFET